MNVPTDIAKSVVESLRGTPFVLVIVLLNTIVLAMFTFTLYSVSNAMERREGLIKACIERK
jgi:Tfp pilus assembly protein PilX